MKRSPPDGREGPASTGSRPTRTCPPAAAAGTGRPTSGTRFSYHGDAGFSLWPPGYTPSAVGLARPVHGRSSASSGRSPSTGRRRRRLTVHGSPPRPGPVAEAVGPCQGGELAAVQPSPGPAGGAPPSCAARSPPRWRTRTASPAARPGDRRRGEGRVARVVRVHGSRFSSRLAAPARPSNRRGPWRTGTFASTTAGTRADR